MSDDNTYKPIRLTSGKKVDYSAIMKRKAEGNKTADIEKRGPGAELAKLGIRGTTRVSFRKDDQGNIIRDKNGNPVTISQFTPTEVPAWFTKAIMILSGHEECYFEGCNEIVDAYKQELATLEARPGGCRECDRSRLKRTYAQKFRNALPPNEANKLSRPIIPPHRVINMETNTITVEPKKPAPFKAIRREVPKELQEAFTRRATESKLIINGQEVEFHGENLSGQPQLPGPSETTGGTSDS